MTKQLIRSYEGKELALDYLKYRPSYPHRISETIMKYVRSNLPNNSNDKLENMLDIGCGSGQATTLFASYFKSVVGTDISSQQIEVANENNNHQNIEYLVVSDGKFPVEDESVDFVNCATAAHWLNIPEFESECQRVLKPNGSVAIYAYLQKHIMDADSGENLSLGDKYRGAVMEFFITIKAHPNNFILVQKYQPIFEQMVNPTKKWIEDITFNKYSTFETFLGFWATIGEYQALMRDGKPKVDPLEELRKS
uniref:putative methyltransferase DDB_G0268948 n=1 Tax=Styela clava TaxID=7725 RepID=UPI00193A598A|nr:putative methyltransferase DDB_G0268948 [Styela clava]